MNPRYRQTCRVCQSSHLKPVINLGKQFLQGSFVKPGFLMPPLRKLPTELVRCDITQNENGCGLLQLAHSFPPEILYANYWYRSGTNATMRDHLSAIAKEALALSLSPLPSVLDIGCNDGTLLSNFPSGTTRFGVDPSDIATEIDDGTTVINTVFPSEQALVTIPEGAIDIVTSIAMFYDLEDPVGFAKSIASVLSQDGVWIFEMSYLPLMLLQNAFDTVCHEHLEYYSLAVLEIIAAKAGLRIFKVTINDVNGGSIRCCACHAGNTAFGSDEDQVELHRLRIMEFDMELDTSKPYSEFQQRIENLNEEFTTLLAKIKRDKKKIHIYGASTKGNVLLQWFGIDNKVVECAADRNPEKAGTRTLGTDIEIVLEKDSRAMKPDYYLVLPWHFKTEFLEREKETIFAGCDMIFPLPHLEIVSKDNFDEILEKSKRGPSQMTDLLFGKSEEHV